MKTFRPYYETIKVGTLSGSQRNLLNGYRYTHYFSPINVPLVVVGFNANFEAINVRLQLADTSEPHAWVPFFQTPMDAIAGAFDDVAPVLYLAEPYLMPPGRRIQVLMQNLTGATINNTQLTLVSVRVDEIEEDYCRVAA